MSSWLHPSIHLLLITKINSKIGMKSEVGLIGYGRFGKLAARKLKKYFKICVFDPIPFKTVEEGIEPVSLEKAASKELVILAVPINQMPSVLKEMAPSVKVGSLICDVCSVKEQPAQWMLNILPSTFLFLEPTPCSDRIPHR